MSVPVLGVLSRGTWWGRGRGGGTLQLHPGGEPELLPLPSEQHQSRTHTESLLAPSGREFKRLEQHREMKLALCVCVCVCTKSPSPSKVRTFWLFITPSKARLRFKTQCERSCFNALSCTTTQRAQLQRGNIPDSAQENTPKQRKHGVSNGTISNLVTSVRTGAHVRAGKGQSTISCSGFGATPPEVKHSSDGPERQGQSADELLGSLILVAAFILTAQRHFGSFYGVTDVGDFVRWRGSTSLVSC